ncbi:hypothetical protein [Pasteuria penetrans]|uniref:hypothetical protein n=1 Tax=Pasteuria penetrans TaxID=86005 RepID=UPI000FB867BD|nr:hypothetical protein [Pasteuria penetrans]
MGVRPTLCGCLPGWGGILFSCSNGMRGRVVLLLSGYVCFGRGSSILMGGSGQLCDE